MKTKQSTHLLIRAVCFILIMLICVYSVLGIFGVNSKTSFENTHNFVNEKRNSLDGVFIGASNVHAFWQSMFGWKQHGIAVWSYSIDALTAQGVKYLMIEARKTQPDALYIICLNTFKKPTEDTSLKAIHNAVDYMPLSVNKYNLIMALTKNYSFADRLEFFFPIIRFHSRWDSLGSWVFGASGYDYKASLHTEGFASGVEDLSKKYKTYTNMTDVTEDIQQCLDDLLDYCDENQVNTLFVKVPQAESKTRQQRMNTLEEYILGRGYPCLDLMEYPEDYVLDLHSDFYNYLHTNVHGSLKFSDYLGKYLVENYHFTDKRGTAGWESWDESAESYFTDYLAPYYLDFELSLDNRTEIDSPVLKKLSISGRDITVSWNAVEGADGYEVFRKGPGNKHWRSVASGDAEMLTYTDTSLKANSKYTYTVVPFQITEEKRLYGFFNVNGINGTTGDDKQ